MIKCISCGAFSLKIICTTCQKNLFQPELYKRELEKDFFVYSFYKYEDIKELINSKYQFFGDRVFNILAKLSFEKFASNFKYSSQAIAIAIDDHTRHSFSHTAILAKALQSKYIKIKYNQLKASHIVKYAGHNLEFRHKNKRDFRYNGDKNLQIILVDDIVTTGSTIQEAKKVLENYGCEVLFALTLSDVKFSKDI